MVRGGSMEEQEFDPKVCDITHREIERRLTSVEQSIKENLERIYSKLDRPSWLETILLSGSFTAIGVMGMYILTHTK
jgi:hypothetical protein